MQVSHTAVLTLPTCTRLSQPRTSPLVTVLVPERDAQKSRCHGQGASRPYRVSRESRAVFKALLVLLFANAHTRFYIHSRPPHVAQLTHFAHLVILARCPLIPPPRVKAMVKAVQDGQKLTQWTAAKTLVETHEKKMQSLATQVKRERTTNHLSPSIINCASLSYSRTYSHCLPDTAR